MRDRNRTADRRRDLSFSFKQRRLHVSTLAIRDPAAGDRQIKGLAVSYWLADENSQKLRSRMSTLARSPAGSLEGVPRRGDSRDGPRSLRQRLAELGYRHFLAGH